MSGNLTRANIRNTTKKELDNDPVQHGSTVGYNAATRSRLVETNQGVVGVTDSYDNSKPFSSTTVTRSGSNNGSRDIKADSNGKRTVTGSYLATGSVSDKSKIDPDLCKPIYVLTVSQVPSEPTDPPQNPEDQEETPEDNPDDQATDDNAPDDPVSRPVGCNPGDDAQWFKDSCPIGSIELGFNTDSNGVNWVLCQSPYTDLEGEGCPIEPGLYGWSCVDGVPTYVANGTYATQEECICVPDEPSEPNNPFIPPDKFSNNANGTACQYDPNGTYNSLQECNEDNGYAPGNQFRARLLVLYNTIKPFTDNIGFCPGKGTTFYAEMFDTGIVGAWNNFYAPISTYVDGDGSIHITGFNDVGLTSPKDIDTGIDIAELQAAVAWNGWAYLYTPPAADVCSSATFATHLQFRNVTWTIQKELLP